MASCPVVEMLTVWCFSFQKLNILVDFDEQGLPFAALHCTAAGPANCGKILSTLVRAWYCLAQTLCISFSFWKLFSVKAVKGLALATSSLCSNPLSANRPHEVTSPRPPPSRSKCQFAVARILRRLL